MRGLRLGMRIGTGGRARFSPLSLFTSGEQGFIYDPSDLSTMFQDPAGTTPVTATGQTVGLVLDKSGRGNHATQSVLASRPIYGIEPFGGRRNLLSQTEDLAISPWTTAVSGVAAPVRTANSAVAPNDTTTATKIDFPAVSASQFSVVTQLVGTGLASVARIGSAWVKASSPADIGKTLFVYGPAQSGQVAIVLTGDWQRITTLVMPANTTASLIFGTLGSAISGGLDQSAFSFLVWGAQLETGSTATAYQRVTDQWNVTQAGVPSVAYLAFDGSDDFLVTNTITPGTDKAQVFAGVRKLSDAASGMLAELSASFGSNSGVFAVQAPGGVFPEYRWNSKGTLGSAATSPSTYAAPITNVLTGIGDIAADTAILRVNGAQAASSTADQGTGNYLAYPAYIGRRGGTTLPFNGRLYGLIVRFGANLTAAQIAQTEAWVNSRTGAY